MADEKQDGGVQAVAQEVRAERQLCAQRFVGVRTASEAAKSAAATR